MLEIINALISSAIQTISVIVFGLFILKEENNKVNSKIYNIIIVLISIILHTIVFITLDGVVKTFLLCIIFMLTFKLLFNVTYGKSLIGSILYIIILIIPDLIVTITFSTIIDKAYFYNNLAGSIIINIVVSILTVAVIILLKKPLKKLINYEFSTNKKIILVSLITLVSLAIFFYNLIDIYEFSNNIAGNLILILTLIIILFYLFKEKIDNEVISKKYDDLLSVMKNYESDIESQRIIMHETKNEFMTIKCKINDNEPDSEIIKYIDNVLGDKKSTDSSKYSKFKYLPSNGIKGFFYYKFMEAEKRNINVSVNISKKVENSFLGNLDTKDFKDLVRIVGVYLDNAIDASSDSDEKKLGIEIYQVKEDIEIIISNTFENEIDMDKVGKERITTKGGNHGHGLLLVKRILNSNPIFEVKTENINNLYIQKLRIKKIK